MKFKKKKRKKRKWMRIRNGERWRGDAMTIYQEVGWMIKMKMNFRKEKGKEKKGNESLERDKEKERDNKGWREGWGGVGYMKKLGLNWRRGSWRE